MADVFVWSGASGLNDGSKWEDAYTTFARDYGAEGGFVPGTDFVYVRSIHSETAAADITTRGTTSPIGDPVRVLCVTGAATGTTVGTLTTGAVVDVTSGNGDLIVLEKITFDGLTLGGHQELRFAQEATSEHWQVYKNCHFKVNQTAASAEFQIGGTGTAGIYVKMINCQFTFGNAGQGFNFMHGTLTIEGGVLNTNLTDLFVSLSNGGTTIGRLRNMDLSILTGGLVDENFIFADCDLLFSRCPLHASTTFMGGDVDIPGAKIRVHHCQAGTDADPSYQLSEHTMQGVVSVDTARYRTGGASDGERTNPVSWDMASSAVALEAYEALESPPLGEWTDGDASTAHVYRVHVASGGTLNDDDLWIEITGPNSAATDSLGEMTSTRMAPLGTPTALTTDSGSTWTGADVGTKQYVQVSYTPDKPGPVTCRVYLAQPSQRVSVDPVIVIDP